MAGAGEEVADVLGVSVEWNALVTTEASALQTILLAIVRKLHDHDNTLDNYPEQSPAAPVDLSGLEERIAALESGAGGSASGSADDEATAGLVARVEALEQATAGGSLATQEYVDEAVRSGGAVGADDLSAAVDPLAAAQDDLGVRLDSLASKVDDLAGALRRLPADVDTLKDRMRRLEDRVANNSGGSGGNRTTNDNTDGAVGAVDVSASEVRDVAETARRALEAADDLERRLTALGESVDAVAGLEAGDVKDLAGKTSALEARLKTLEHTVDNDVKGGLERNAARLAQLATTIDRLQEQVAAKPDTDMLQTMFGLAAGGSGSGDGSGTAGAGVPGAGGDGDVGAVDNELRVLVAGLNSKVSMLVTDARAIKTTCNDHEQRIQDMSRRALDAERTAEALGDEVGELQAVAESHEGRLTAIEDYNIDNHISRLRGRLELQDDKVKRLSGAVGALEAREKDAALSADSFITVRRDLDELRLELDRLPKQQSSSADVRNLARDVIQLQHQLAQKQDKTAETADTAFRMTFKEIRDAFAALQADLAVLDRTRVSHEAVTELLERKADTRLLHDKVNLEYVHTLNKELRALFDARLDELGIGPGRLGRGGDGDGDSDDDGDDDDGATRRRRSGGSVVDVVASLSEKMGRKADRDELRAMEQLVSEMRHELIRTSQVVNRRPDEDFGALTYQHLPSSNHCLTCDRHIFDVPNVRPLTLPMFPPLPGASSARVPPTAAEITARSTGFDTRASPRYGTLSGTRAQRMQTAPTGAAYGLHAPRPPQAGGGGAAAAGDYMRGRDGHLYRGGTPRRHRSRRSDRGGEAAARPATAPAEGVRHKHAPHPPPMAAAT